MKRTPTPLFLDCYTNNAIHKLQKTAQKVVSIQPYKRHRSTLVLLWRLYSAKYLFARAGFIL